MFAGIITVFSFPDCQRWEYNTFFKNVRFSDSFCGRVRLPVSAGIERNSEEQTVPQVFGFSDGSGNISAFV